MTPEERVREIGGVDCYGCEFRDSDEAMERCPDHGKILRAIRAAIGEEREACAKTVETLAYGAAAAAIRARR